MDCQTEFLAEIWTGHQRLSVILIDAIILYSRRITNNSGNAVIFLNENVGWGSILDCQI